MLKPEMVKRYSRQIMVPQFGEQGQEHLLNAHVAIVGLGGLGSPVVQYLAASGIGQFTLLDDDVIAVENLHRQLLYRETDVGQRKVDLATRWINQCNPSATVTAIAQRLSGAALQQVFDGVDLVLDCTDSFNSRQEVNGAAVASRKAHIVGTAIRTEGQLICFDHALSASPCLGCILTPEDASTMTCAESGVLGPVLGVIGSAMALAALKYLTMPSDYVVNKWQFFDGRKQSWMSLNIEANSACSTCGEP